MSHAAQADNYRTKDLCGFADTDSGTGVSVVLRGRISSMAYPYLHLPQRSQLKRSIETFRTTLILGCFKLSPAKTERVVDDLILWTMAVAWIMFRIQIL